MPSAFHLVPEAWYAACPPDEPYLPEGFEREGFVHLTHGLDEVLAVGNAFYRDDPRPYLLLTIDLERAGAHVRYDDPAGRYPHVYGPLARASIVEIRRLRRADDGAFLGVEPAPPAPFDTATGRDVRPVS